MRLLITGYPGWLTNRFLETLSDYPQKFSSVRLLVHPHQLKNCATGPWEIVTGDLNDLVALKKAVEGQDVILHAAGIIHVKKIRDYYDVNRDGTRHLLEAAVGANVRKFIYISSNAAQGFCEGKGFELDEDSACRPKSHYGISKKQAEEIVQQYHVEGKIKTVSLRPAMFYGPPVAPRHVDIYKRIQSGRFYIFGHGNYLRSVTYIDHLVQAIHLVALSEVADGKIYSIADKVIPTLNQIIQAIADAQGVKLNIIRLPVWIAGACNILDDFLSALNIYSMLPHIVGESCKNIAFKIDRAEMELGFKSILDYREGYKRTIAWCRKQKLL